MFLDVLVAHGDRQEIWRCSKQSTHHTHIHNFHCVGVVAVWFRKLLDNCHIGVFEGPVEHVVDVVDYHQDLVGHLAGECHVGWVISLPSKKE